MSRLPWLLSILAFAAGSCLAQFENAEVLGTVRDPTGSVVAKASITLTNQDTGIEAKTTTDENGNYTFSNVKVGRYTVTAEAAGFSKAVAKDINVDVNARQRVDLSLQVGAVTESVQVTGAASALETDSSEHGQVINTQQIVELPLERPQLCGPGAAGHQHDQIADGGFLFGQRHAARGRLQRERHAQHL